MNTLHLLRRKFEVSKDEEARGMTTAWINRDIVPLPPSRRTWGAWSFVGFWLLTGFNISGWTTGSSLLGLGLNVWQAMVSVVVGQLIIGCAVVANGFVGAEWHVGFPVYNRFVWGVYGSFFPLIMRILLSVVWYGVQLVFGGKSVKVIIGAIWPSFYTLRNTLPADTGIELNDLIGILVFAAISTPLLLVPPEHYRKPFVVGSIIMTVTAFAIFVWALAKQGGAGPLLAHPSELSGAPALSGSALGWAMAYGVSSTVGSTSAGVLNQSDYTRFAAYPRAQILSQLVIVPVSTVLVALIGVVVTSCAAGFYPAQDGLLWAPYDLLQVVQTSSGGSPGARAACFFAGCAFVVSQLGINIPGNAISGGIDLAGLLPRYINIRRGAFITAVLGIVICPWKLLVGSNVFLTVLSSFSVFLGPLTGVMVSDYLIVRQRKLRLTHLYIPSPRSTYYFTYGVNFRALLSWILGVWPLMPGFVSAVSPPSSTLSVGWTRCYDLAWPLGFVLSAFAHVLLSRIMPPEGLGEVDEADIFGTFTSKTIADAPPMSDGECDSVEVEQKDVIPV